MQALGAEHERGGVMKEQLTVRIDPKLMEKVKAIAKTELRSLNNTFEYLLARGIAEYEKGTNDRHPLKPP